MNEQDKETSEDVLDQEQTGETTPEPRRTNLRKRVRKPPSGEISTCAIWPSLIISANASRAELEGVRESVAEGVLLNLLTVYDDMNRMLEAPGD
jgi:hypothetical protein